MFKRINKVIKVLIISDFFLNSALGIYSPVFALFIMQRITGDMAEAAKVAGFATLFYWTAKSLLQIPLAVQMDKRKGEKDDFYFMIVGALLASLAPLGFIISSSAWHIYLFNILQSVGMAMTIPSWYAIFTRHVDKGKEAFEWGANSSFLSLGVGITGALGGITAALFGFNFIFIATAVLGIISTASMIAIRKDLCEKRQEPLKELPLVNPF
ncbi:MAG: hypothetical protein A2365_02285 [Candidatus Nealsonbacteria bacterium RIFOXYB1_FULL_40_15]|uniref:Major facilitator superfamily (MFS) profile domain-containing protein n=1 Tax=Candidatus Nealsonbacteria bacterium RIFOXYB1_FULL_40_15 TaxID=1801677 RepID=A0A1G2ENL2_9BACT|nr:MAG: hypothetical protein A2365_02285 [Candidatus Nealsonbacteria bacterium RIFOXYB1_FULL_40_15]OGZ28484.1 MAG: hypothetical protein A2562_03375 [Candidatus Nealsonbacteria bacterium RIFOXYD1_FULL_39_11]